MTRPAGVFGAALFVVTGIGRVLGPAMPGAAVLVADKPAFTNVWHAPEASTIRFVGKKVAALVISTDQDLRVSAEEQLVAEIAKRGVNGVATYRMAPREELTTAERARPWFERAGVEGVVALRPVAAETEVIHSPTQWVTNSYYSTLWGYYGYGWSGVLVPGSTKRESTVVVETLIFSLPLDKLLWAATSTTTNPAQQREFVKQLVESTTEEMRKQRLIE